MYKKLLLFFITAVFVQACSPVRYVKPLQKKQQAATVALGGPLIGYGAATIPIPFLTANYGYGIDSTFTGFASVNITSALFGNVQAELGATKQLLKQKNYIPSVSITPVVNIIYRDKNAKKLYPQLSLNAFWEYGQRKNFIYIACDNWFELSTKRAFGVEQSNHWIVMPALGHSFVGKKSNLNIEAKIIAPNLSNQKLVVDYKTPLGNHGAFGVYLSYTYKFN